MQKIRSKATSYRLLPPDETDDEHVASAFTATTGLAPPRSSLVSQMAIAMQHQHQPPTSSLQVRARLSVHYSCFDPHIHDRSV